MDPIRNLPDTQDINLNENISELNLHNGIRVILNNIPNFQTSAIGFFVKKGSRDENTHELGYSHFSEHMIFKGTLNYNKKQIASIFDKMGGYINAYTTHEQIALYNRIPYYLLLENTKLMVEIFNNSTFQPTEMEMEKEVIINEIRSDMEDPHEKIHEDFMRNIFPNQSLGLSIIGNEESIKNARKEKLFDFYQNTFNRHNLLIAISGKFNKDEIIGYLENLEFRDNRTENKISKAIQGNEQHFFSISPSEQVHIIMGTSQFTLNDQMYFKSGLLNIIIGESMSSRFFQIIREEQGLCYTIYTFINKFRYENVFALYTSVMPKNVDKLVKSVSLLIQELITHGITEEELENAKTQKIGEIILSYDVLQKRMQRIAFMEISMDKIYTLPEIISIINSTTREEINELIKKIFVKDHFITQILYKNKLKIKDWEF